jgi:hypothetical protein
MNKLLPALVMGALLAAHGVAFAQTAKPAEPAASAAKADAKKADEKKDDKKKKEKKGGC